MLGRICLSLIFVTSVANQILTWDTTVQYFTNTLSDWLHQPNLPLQIIQALHFLMDHASLAVSVATLFAGLGGILVLLGIKVRLGVTLLILFLIPVTLLMHAFWLYVGPQKDLQMIMFLKNLSILGGLFILAGSGGEK